MQAVEQRRHPEHLVHGHDARAADAHHAHAEVLVADEPLGLGQLNVEVGRAVLCLLARDDREEGGAVPLEAGQVLVARGLVNLGLAAELGLHRDDREAVRLLAAVAATLADALVDPDALRRLGRLAALALAAQLGGALLVVDQDRHPLHTRELLLRGEQLLAVAHIRYAGELDAAVAARVLGGNDDPPHAFELEPARQVPHAQLDLDVLAAGHGDVLVVEQLVGDVHAGRDGRAHRERARVVEGAVAEVLHQMAVVGERRHADPLRALAAHLRDAGDLALALGVQQHHRVAADPGAHERALRRLYGAVVRAAGAEERRALRHRQLRRPSLDLRQLAQAGLDRIDPDAARAEARRHRPADQVGVEVQLAREQRLAALVLLAEDARSAGCAVERVLQEGLDERALLLRDQYLVEPAGELAGDLRLERRDHAELQDADAGALEGAAVEPELAQGVHQVVVGLAGDHDAEPGALRALDAVQTVLARVRERQLGAWAEEGALHVERGGCQQVAVRHVLVGLAVPLHGRHHRHHPVRRDGGGGDGVGHAGHDLEARPEAGGARAGERVQADVEHLLHVPREEDRHLEARKQGLGGARDRGGLAARVVADDGEAAAGARDADEVAVAQGVGGAVEAWRLAVPHGQHAVVAGARELRGQLAAPGGRGTELLVEARHVAHVVLLDQLPVAGELLVEAAQRRALVAGDHRPRVEAAATVGAVLVERQTDQALEAGQQDAARLEEVLVVERDVEKRPATAAVAVARAPVAASPAEVIGSRGAPPGSSALGYGDRHPAPLSRRARPRSARRSLADWLNQLTIGGTRKAIPWFCAQSVDAVYNRV